MRVIIHHGDGGGVVGLQGGSIEVGLCLCDHWDGEGLVLVVPTGPLSPIFLQLIIELEDVLGADVPG